MAVTKTVIITPKTSHKIPKWVLNYWSAFDKWAKASYPPSAFSIIGSAPEGAEQKFAELSGVTIELDIAYKKTGYKMKYKFIWENGAARTMFMMRFGC